MPVIVRLQYCVIRMYFEDHNPPHFHVDTTEGRVLLTIADLAVMEGKVGSRALKEAQDWATENRDRLWTFWQENHR
jgi:hypothetical protein